MLKLQINRVFESSEHIIVVFFEDVEKKPV
jgi:hypothetical protein